MPTECLEEATETNFYRVGGWPLFPSKENVTRIWIQAVSVGELSSIAKLLDFLLSNPSIEVVLTGTTSTGLKMQPKIWHTSVVAPSLDWLPFSRRVWRTIEPDINPCGGELWPEHFHQAKEIFQLSLSMPASLTKLMPGSYPHILGGLEN